MRWIFSDVLEKGVFVFGVEDNKIIFESKVECHIIFSSIQLAKLLTIQKIAF